MNSSNGTPSSPTESRSANELARDERRLQPPFIIQADDLEWREPSAPKAGGSLVARYCHAFRRRWPAACFLALLLSGTAGVGVWYALRTPQYTAEAQIRISSSDPSLLFATGDAQGQTAFDIFKRTQQQIIRGQEVLKGALNDQRVAELPIVKQQVDATAWLQQELNVSFPGDAELMQITLTTEDQDASRLLVTAVYETYLSQAGSYDRDREDARLAALNKAYGDKQKELTEKRNELHSLVTEFGSADAQSLTLDQQSTIHQYTALLNHKQQIAFEVMEARRELELLKRRREQAETPNEESGAEDVAEARDPANGSEPRDVAVETPPSENPSQEHAPQDGAEALGSQEAAARASAPPANSTTASADAPLADGESGTADDSISEIAFQEFLLTHPTAGAQARKLKQLRSLARTTEERLGPSAKAGTVAAQYLDSYRSEIEGLEAELEEQRPALQQDYEEYQRALLASKVPAGTRTRIDPILDLEDKIEIWRQQEEQLETEIEDLQAESRAFGKSSLRIEILRVDIASLQDVVKDMRREIEQVQVEMSADLRHRVSRLQEPFVRTSDNKRQISMAGAAGLVGLCLPIFLVLWWDTRQGRINTPAEVTDRVGLSVIGAVPHIPRRQFARLQDPSHRQEYWRVQLNESINGIVARLLREASLKQSRVLMVSSAVAGEGKTTLAGHLAISLAAAGRRTVLIDFDIRRPALDRAFGVEPRPGVGDILGQPEHIPGAVQTTAIENLSLIAAGSGKHNALARLTPQNLTGLFGALRAEFEFVIVDGSPILPVVDGRLIGQHVDAVILSVLRDVTRADKLLAAREILESFDIPVLGTVVTGTSTEVYYSPNSNRRPA